MIYDANSESIQLGSFRITRLSDGLMSLGVEQIVANAPVDVAKAAMAIGGAEISLTSRVTALLIQTGEKNILVDTAWGRWDFAERGPEGEPITAHLAKLGLGRDDIDIVVLSHFHPDHIGGNCVEEAGVIKPRYGNARYRAQRADWDFYTHDDRLNDPAYGPFLRNSLLPLAEHGVLDLFDRGNRIAPGVTALPTPGHSPGHCVIVLSSGQETAMYLGDVAHHPVHLEHPEWHGGFDVDARTALESRRWLYDRIAWTQSWIIGCHFMAPGVGKLSREGGGYRWIPAGSQPPA